MKQISILLVLVFVLASCTWTEEKKAMENSTPIIEAEVVEEAKKEMLAEVIEDTTMEKEEVIEKEAMEGKEDDKMNDKMMEEKGTMETKEEIAKDETVVEEVMEDKEVMEKWDEAMIEKEVVMEKTAWSYQDYSETAVKTTKGNKVLFFHATWCPSCKSADKNLSSETIADDLTIFKVDYDSNLDLRKKYGVTSQHTFVLVDDNMEKIKAMVSWSNSADVVNGLLN